MSLITCFHRIITSHQGIIYKQTLELGGPNMINDKTNFTFTNIPEITKEVFKEDKSLIVFSRIKRLDVLLNDKIDEYKKHVKSFQGFNSKLEWLLNWKSTEKKDILDSILFTVSCGFISSRKLNILMEIISGYFDYFEILSQEPISEERFEETFNTILQIPAEVYDFVKANEICYEAEFINNICYKDENKKKSREEIKQDGCIDLLCA